MSKLNFFWVIFLASCLASRSSHASSRNDGISSISAISAKTGVIEPASIIAADQPTGIELSDEMLESVRQWERRRYDLREPAIPVGPQFPFGPSGCETNPGVSAKDPIIIFDDSEVYGLNKDVVNEPSHAGGRGRYFFTGNFYAARSTNGGRRWISVSPSLGMSDFCCDQDVVYDPKRDLMVWYRQSFAKEGSNGNARLVISSSVNGGETWCTYSLYPYQVDPAYEGTWWDYPHLALSEHFLYFSTNRFDANWEFQGAHVFKWPLDAMADCDPVTYEHVLLPNPHTATPVQGALSVMFFGQHLDTETFRITRWPEDQSSLTFVDVSILPWAGTDRGEAHCESPDGGDACRRLDSRPTGGWFANEEIGWFWTVKEGYGFHYPFINAARFSVLDFRYLGRPYIYSQQHAWIYGYGSPNASGDLGISMWRSGGATFPELWVGIDDEQNGDPPGWEVTPVVMGIASPDSLWGDYLRIRSHVECPDRWTVSGHILLERNRIVPHFSVIGRDQIRPCSATPNR